MAERKKEWYESRKAVYFMLVLFFPMGLYGLWKNESFWRPTKILLTSIIGAIVVGYAFVEPLPPPPAPQETRANEQGRVLIDLAGNNPPMTNPATPVENARISPQSQKTKRTKEEWRQHAADLRDILDGIEKRRRRLEDGYSYKDGAWLVAWNKETQQWRKNIEGRVDFSRIRLSPCESASFDTATALGDIVQLGIGYIYKDRRPGGVTVEQKSLREDFQLARKGVSECTNSLKGTAAINSF